MGLFKEIDFLTGAERHMSMLSLYRAAGGGRVAENIYTSVKILYAFLVTLSN